MRFYIICLLLLIFNTIKSIKIETNCNDINPLKSSDCKLSQEDKKLYKYCCYEEFNGVNYCYAYNKFDYKMQLETYKETKNKLGVEYTFECNSSKYLNILLIYFILILF